MKKKQIMTVCVITAVVSIILTSVFYFSPFGMMLVSICSDSPVASGYGKLMRIEKYIDNNYMGEYSPDYLMDRAVHGYVASLGDPYSSYFNKKEFEGLNQQLDGEYRGIGVTVGAADGKIRINSVNADSPAEKSGVIEGDFILKINGTGYTGAEVSKAIDVIKSTDIGETVTITVERDGSIIDIPIKIEKILKELVKSQMLDSSTGYIYLSTFGTGVSKDFSKALEELKSKHMRCLVVDLRNNPGGTLDSAVEIADMLLGECTIVSVKDKHGNEQVYSSDKKEVNLPICVLVNESSASASEVLSAALRDNGKATLVGKKTFGKGVVQSVVDFGDGTGISVTIAKYYTPSGVCINGVGIVPDVEVDLAQGADVTPGEISKNDAQLETAKKVLSQKLFK